jgi:hypothetical protein
MKPLRVALASRSGAAASLNRARDASDGHAPAVTQHPGRPEQGRRTSIRRRVLAASENRRPDRVPKLQEQVSARTVAWCRGVPLSWRPAMEANALKSSDYEHIEWTGRPHLAAVPAAKSPVCDFDTSQVWLTSDRMLRYWTRELGVTMYDIRDAIAVTGTRCAVEVRSYLTRLR